MKRKVLAVVLGALVAVVLIIAIEWLSHLMYPMPIIDFSDAEAVRAYVTGAPIGALLMVMAAWLVATVGGGLLACRIARETPFVYAAIIGGLVLLGTVINLLSIPHPLWFSLTSVMAIITTIFVTGRLGSAFVVTKS